MALHARLEMRQGQQLVMTPQLQQAIRLLQFSNMELNAFVEQELERNPLLERDEREDADHRTIDSDPGDAPMAETAAGPDLTLDLAKPDGDSINALDTDYETVAPDASVADIRQEDPGQSLSGTTSSSSGSTSFGDDDINLEAFVASEVSLKDHLTLQMQMTLTTPADRLVGQHLIDAVDDAGYLNVELAAIAEKLGASVAMMERILGRLQQCEPAGVFARSLAECLKLQLIEQNRYDPVIAKLLEHLDLLASHNMQALRRAVGVDMDELVEMIGELKQLNPKPGLAFGSVAVQPVVPDVLVRAAVDGGWFIELNSETLPRVLVNRSYYTRVSKTARSPGDKDYLLDCLQTANWLVKSLDQRARTILRVAEEIIRQQDGFFAHGVQHLRPLNLKTVADAIKMHESTVSRVTSNKYMATPRGIFELKYFFMSAIASSEDGATHSSEAVRHRIKQMIDAEKVCAVLSDDKIVEKLNVDGIDIARRTVAKYREAMRIPSSVQRRREKKMSTRTDARLESQYA
jgi:RNA polymerase sigma-54 factor